ncbi:ATP phosphoribosyltransferase regulatory subunit [Halocynthiibacter namhaensis]|uniref:ATP phosphoribosyltransferase regulatory subunit n=1 Tax=Halocynthiibacter namhaensis TaxID=1290553 RepID=UPI000579372C|nr:ATP phosphoribosyltransferase regulatory subunit [Halocynthiibacter namhaensis]
MSCNSEMFLRQAAEAARLRSFFEMSGAQLVEADMLQPAEVLLDLYGEDIRARAYVTSDPLRGELMLRPDFTVPVVQMHMNHGAEPARYTYSGKVFRRQEEDLGRASEYLQVGYEVFDRDDPAGADAEVFALFNGVLRGKGLTAVTGDMGILRAAISGLSTSDRRKAALERHIWRPRKFRSLLDRYSNRTPLPAVRVKLLELMDTNSVDVLLENAGAQVGLRREADVRARLEVIKADAQEQPISRSEAEMLEEILTLRAPAPQALSTLRDIAVDLPKVNGAIEGFETRLNAMAQRGIDVANLDFDASHGRSSMEYYDGFVFSFLKPGQPPVATGGRYDALTKVLGQGRSIPAVGGVIRPDLLINAESAQ